MTSLRTLLAMNMEQLLTIGIAVMVAALIFAFLLGFSRGFKRVGKGCLYWLIAGGAFIFLYQMTAEKNFLGGTVPSPFEGFVWGILLIIACIVATLVLFGSISALFRPSDKVELCVDWDEVCEYDPDGMDRPVFKPMTFGKYHKRKVGMFSRLCGGVICMINTAIILATVAMLFLLVADTTSLNEKFAAVLDNSAVQTVLSYAYKYFIDFATVGIIFYMGTKGFKTGFIGATRILFKKLGIIVALVLGFALPFIAHKQDMTFIIGITEKLASIGVLSKLGKFAQIAGNLIAGVLFVSVGCLLVALIDIMLKRLNYNIRGTTVIRFFDGSLAMLIYLALGVFIVLAVWAAIYVFDYLGIFDVREVFREDTFTKECCRVIANFLEEFMDRYLSKFKVTA